MLPLALEKKYLLDGKTEIIVLKPVNRSLTLYKIEVPGHSIELVDRTRLKELTNPA